MAHAAFPRSRTILNSPITMDMQILEIAAVIILVIIGIFIYRNKTQ